MKNQISKYIVSSTIIMVVVSLTMSGCKKDFFDKQPLDRVSDATFWKTEGDAKLALTGVYRAQSGWGGQDWWHPLSMMWLDLMAGNGSEKEMSPDRVTDGSLNSAYWVTSGYWDNSYQRITTCNNFLAHIGTVTMDENAKKIMIAEVRALRAYEYFNLTVYFGDVPLVKNVLNISEANSVSRASKSEIWSFLETELKESAAVLPVTRPNAESGRFTAGSALAVLGRLQMFEKKWSDAAVTYKKIIDSKAYIVQDDFSQLFYISNEFSKEIILSTQYIQDTYSHPVPQYLYPEAFGGWHQFSPYNELVKEFECIDGRPITESPLYNTNTPYANRDPRLDFTIMISDRSMFRGQTYVSRPGTSSPDRFNRYGWSGYCIMKTMDPSYTGNLQNSGQNAILIRYPEVLLGYLESMIESGGGLTQSLLDQTINVIRKRSSVNMPAVTQLDPASLRTIVRRERRVELAFEGIRYYDILRWGIAAEELNKQFTGMKLTNTPSTYRDFPVDDQGYFIYQKRAFKKGINELWPIPQKEIQVNKNLKQNAGY
ncbi:RagB/SusD family nutrient uptake outer membrane protein [Pedobacter sp. BMA]|uniref:RagB/SusD family nutrient uptake outer membrane protein n=1 Tax=Pedobacter sp. BMA TaxID=1663685 RepID=UPI000649AE76|nr:RagB/SusD family nutrient uptake outer membrane protein [Pedobacter sp. BMA]KLT67062.1 glycan metabolism protein RagB [Pedobacter sp. BMA]